LAAKLRPLTTIVDSATELRLMLRSAKLTSSAGSAYNPSPLWGSIKGNKPKLVYVLW